MDEAEWLTCEDPEKLLGCFWTRQRGRFSRRKGRLFRAACCRSILAQLPQALAVPALDFAERLADGLAAEDDRKAVSNPIWDEFVRRAQESGNWLIHYDVLVLVRLLLPWQHTPLDAIRTAEAGQEAVANAAGERAAAFVMSADEAAARGYEFHGHPPWVHKRSVAEARRQATTVRDVYGNPFRRVSISSLVHTPAVLARAQDAYDARLPDGRLDNGRLAVLSDALVDAGCEDALLLEHLRGEGPFYRGMWSLDVVLDKQ